MPHFVAIVITYQPDASAIENIRRLAQHTDHVIVVDNTATVSVRDKLSRIFAFQPETFTLLFNETNTGIASALNRGMVCAVSRQADWVLTMDQDSQITDGMVKAMLATYNVLPSDIQQQVASLAPTQSATGSDNGSATAESSVRPNFSFKEVPTAITSGNLIKPDVWQTVGGFEEKLFIDYVDHDFCFRLRRAGKKIIECEDARLIHKIGNATEVRWLGRKVIINQHAPLRSYYIARNGLYFWRTFPEPCDFIRSDQINMLKLVLKAFLFDTHKAERLLMFWRGYLDFLKGRFGPYSEIHPQPRSDSKALHP